jgi:hypothetical protein
MPTLGTPHRVVNKFGDAISPVASRACSELHSLIQDLSTSRCLVSFFETGRDSGATPRKADPRHFADAAPQHRPPHLRHRSHPENEYAMSIGGRAPPHPPSGRLLPPAREGSAGRGTSSQTKATAPFSKGGAAAAAGHWRLKAWGPSCAATWGSFEREAPKRAGGGAGL